jgi:catechol 2,3-dioxygenase-like lactoylglutathione lyase family enzyme
MSVPVQDMERAKRFYSETLGIHSPNLEDGWPEFETRSGVCNGTSFTDPDGSGIMLHHRYARCPNGSLP